MGLFGSLFKQKTTKQLIIDKFYSVYPEIPYISDARGADWIEQAELFPKQCIIPKTMMTRYSDGLLPGHVYMLYWLKKHTNKRIPAYFEYKYGIDFCKEKEFLINNGYLYDDKPTSKGMEAIKYHYEIIEEQHPTPLHRNDHSQSAPSLMTTNRIISNDMTEGNNSVPQEDKTIIDLEFENINKLVSFAVKLSGIKIRLKINTEEFLYGERKTYYDYHPKTPSGRSAKYPLTLHYKCGGRSDINLDHDRFGEINYLENGSIGSARLIFWDRKIGHIIHLGIIEKELSVKKVEVSTDSKWVPLYKN